MQVGRWVGGQVGRYIQEAPPRGPRCECQCGAPRVYGTPCSHVFALGSHMRVSPVDLTFLVVDPKLRLDNICAALFAADALRYPPSDYHTHLAASQDLSIQAPRMRLLLARRRAGRPKGAKKRRHAPQKSPSVSGGKKRRCGACGELGNHNARTCGRDVVGEKAAAAAARHNYSEMPLFATTRHRISVPLHRSRFSSKVITPRHH